MQLGDDTQLNTLADMHLHWHRHHTATSNTQYKHRPGSGKIHAGCCKVLSCQELRNCTTHPPGNHDLALLLMVQLQCFGHIQPGVLVLAVQAVAARGALPGRNHSMHHVPHIRPCQHKQQRHMLATVITGRGPSCQRQLFFYCIIRYLQPQAQEAGAGLGSVPSC